MHMYFYICTGTWLTQLHSAKLRHYSFVVHHVNCSDSWAAWYNNWPLIKPMPKGVVLSFLTEGAVPMQLRNLLWATSKHDLYFMHDHCVKHWNSLTRQTAEVIHNGSSQLLPCKFSISDIPHFAIACKQIYFACCTPPSDIIWHACLLQSRR